MSATQGNMEVIKLWHRDAEPRSSQQTDPPPPVLSTLGASRDDALMMTLELHINSSFFVSLILQHVHFHRARFE